MKRWISALVVCSRRPYEHGRLRRLAARLVGFCMAVGMIGVGTEVHAGIVTILGTPIPIPGAGAQNARFWYVTPDAQTMLLVSDAPTHIYKSTFDTVAGEWGPRQSLGFPDWASTPSLDPDGNLFYSQHFPPSGNKIYRATPSGDGWSSPGSLVEIPDGPHKQVRPYFFDGRQLYFGDYPDDIMLCDFDPATGKFSPAESLDTINRADSHEAYPWVSEDGMTMLFSSDRPGGFGGMDLYSATRSSLASNIWTDVTNLGPAVNTADGEFIPVFAADTNTLYFSRGDHPVANLQVEASLTVIPEPASAILWLGMAATGLLACAWRRKRRS